MSRVTVVIPAVQVADIRRKVADSLAAVEEDLHLQHQEGSRARRGESQRRALATLLAQLEDGEGRDRTVIADSEPLREAIFDVLVARLEQLLAMAIFYWCDPATLARLESALAALDPYLALLGEIERQADRTAGVPPVNDEPGEDPR